MENDNAHTQKSNKRRIAPEDIALPKGYKIDVFAAGLNTPINLIFDNFGEMYLADAGITSGDGKLLRFSAGRLETIAEGFNPPLTGITFYQGEIYVAHRGNVTKVSTGGRKENIIEGLPSWGDHHNNRVVFSSRGKMYFGQGTATNSGVVGEDNNSWLGRYPYFHDYPGSTIVLSGQNFRTRNLQSACENDYAYTGAFSPYGVPNYPGEIAKGIEKAGGSILRADPDGSNLELVAWGFRNPFRMKFDCDNRLFTTNHGMDERGSRPVANSPDEFIKVKPGTWYGWPDYTGGLPVTLPAFKPEKGPKPSSLLACHPMVPPKPFSAFKPHSAIMGFDFNYNYEFGEVGDVYIAEFGSEAPRTTGGKPLTRVGHKVSRIDMNTGDVRPFAVNKTGYAASYTGGGGFERPIDVVFGLQGEMYIVDFGVEDEESQGGYAPNTGVIWKVTRKK
ncbi:MAG: PQQ-dependent sugar dehydrogenase [Caulobacteraceae bacterium]